MPKTGLTFLFVPFDGVGHINALIGLGQELVNKGHTVVFAISNSWKGKLIKFGFIEKYVQDESRLEVAAEKLGELVQALSPVLAGSVLDKLKYFNTSGMKVGVAYTKDSDEHLRAIVAETKPDLILVDIIHNPSLSDVGIPWMIVLSLSPLGISTENVPPNFSGLSTFGADKAIWAKFAEEARAAYAPVFEDFKNWVLEKGGPELKYEGKVFWSNPSSYGNLYMYPKELNYTMHRPDPPNWYQFDTFARYDLEPFVLPSKLENLPGKLVYVSLGTIGCSELTLMRKIIEICSKSAHRFIFSKGLLGDQLELADNMWGANHLPQTNILPLVDLVITHGGNNTLTETFYFGKRVLLLPLFGDQLDNGTRVEETGLGLQFNPYKVTEEQLLGGIETLLGDDLLEKRMLSIGTRIQSTNGRLRAAKLLEDVAKKNSRNPKP